MSSNPREEEEEEPVEELVTPGVAADADDDAKLECMKLLAEMEAMDKETERLNAALELQQMRSMLAAMTEISSRPELLSAVRSTMQPTMAATANDADPKSPESVMASSEPSSPASTAAAAAAAAENHASSLPPPAAAPPPAAPRQSALSAEQRAQLDGLLQEDVVVTADLPRGEHFDAQTSTLRRLMSGSQPVPPSQLSQTAAPLTQAVAQALSEAQSNFVPDTTAVDEQIAKMERELKALQLEKQIREQEMELRKLQALIEAESAAESAAGMEAETIS